MTISLAGPDRTFAAAGAVLIYAVIIGYIDNHVRLIAEGTGLWQFQAMRSVMAVAIMSLWLAMPMAKAVRVKHPARVFARALIMSAAIFTYFGSLGFLSVAQAAAGLFTAPIFVLLIGRFGFGHHLGPVQIIAAILGFAGVLLVLSPDLETFDLVSLVPILGGALYALANIATREWCREESAEALTYTYMILLGIIGTTGLVVLWLWGPEVPPGSDGFLLRGPEWPSVTVLFWTFVQAIGSLVALLFLVRAYQIAEANRVAVFEYMVLPFSAIWAWLIWHEATGLAAQFGMLLILVAGVAIIWSGGRAKATADT